MNTTNKQDLQKIEKNYKSLNLDNKRKFLYLTGYLLEYQTNFHNNFKLLCIDEIGSITHWYKSLDEFQFGMKNSNKTDYGAISKTYGNYDLYLEVLKITNTYEIMKKLPTNIDKYFRHQYTNLNDYVNVKNKLMNSLNVFIIVNVIIINIKKKLSINFSNITFAKKIHNLISILNSVNPSTSRNLGLLELQDLCIDRTNEIPIDICSIESINDYMSEYNYTKVNVFGLATEIQNEIDNIEYDEKCNEKHNIKYSKICEILNKFGSSE
jgi:hypothetical protein